MKESRRCTAKLSDGSRRCRLPAIVGGTVCHKHGGSAMQVRRSARARIAALTDPAIAALAKALEADDLNAAIRAARLVLDRAGVRPMTDIEAFYNEQADVLRVLIDGILSSFGIRLTAPHVAAVVRRELSRVAGVELEADEKAVQVAPLSERTLERIQLELAGEDVDEPETMIM